MQVDYAKAEARPSPNFWPGNEGRDYIVVHATASGGVEEVPNFGAATGKSTTYAISRAGKVVQYVSENNSHWGNCCTSGNSPFVTNPNKPAGYNYNHNTIAIENEKYSNDNAEPLEAVQYEALLDLVRDIAERWKIPLVHGTPSQRGVIFHHDLDPVNRARCPGTFPYGTFFTDLQQGGGSQDVKLNADGTVATVPFWYQLSENEMNTCGPTTCAMAQFSVQPGGQLVATSETIDQETDAIIKDVFGLSDPKQFGGVDTWGHDMYNILVYLRDKYHKSHFVEVSTMEDLEKGIHAGYLGIFGCNEADVTAWNKNTQAWVHAYTWNLSAGHIPGVLVGIEAGTGNWRVVDPLNNRFQGYGPPYIYKRSDIAKSFTGGAIIQLTDWLQSIPPLNQWPAGFNAQNFTGGGNMGVPTGWKDDGSTLTAPNNVPVRSGYRSKVIAGWDASNYPVKPEFGRNPVEQSNTALGPGTWQNFRQGALAYTVQRGVYVPYVGQELQWYMDNYDSVQKERDALKKQVSDLQAQLAASSGGTGIPQVVRDDIMQLASHVTPAASMLEKLVKDAGL
jgi:hypothetical protein